MCDPALQRVHLQVLHYLARCNRYSDRPAAVAAYLGITKGTASQTIGVLEALGLVVKRADGRDRRIVHVAVTQEGQRTGAGAGSAQLLDAALATLLDPERERLAELLAKLLQGIQRAGGGRAFGVCDSCRHFLREGATAYRCGLTSEPLSIADSALICIEHEDLIGAGVADGPGPIDSPDLEAAASDL